jgi:hypothetical protein
MSKQSATQLKTPTVGARLRLPGPLAAIWHQLKKFDAMVRAGREMEILLRAEGSAGTAAKTDRSALLWRTFAKHGVDLRRGDAGAAAEQRESQDRDSSIEGRIALARIELQLARTRLTKEIAGYPTPIAGCDCQFNYLLAARSKIAAALAALDQDNHMPSPKRA